MPKFSPSMQNLNLAEIRMYHFDIDEALKTYFNPKNLDLKNNPEYIQYTHDELIVIREKRREELRTSCCFNILAALEASFRIDFRLRCEKKTKDPLSKKFFIIFKNKKNLVHLEQDILECWQDFFEETNNTHNKRIISELKSALKFRHWLAHGRYWIPNLGQKKYNYIYLYQLAEAIYNNFEFKSFL
jgi:hypothetical protein